jgi:hypothetical protein
MRKIMAAVGNLIDHVRHIPKFSSVYSPDDFRERRCSMAIQREGNWLSGHA